MADYSEIILKGVEILVDAKLRDLNFDTTLTCTVIDDSSADLGTYVVSDGSVKFTAYSTDTTYKNNDQVYVSIPNNDYTEQKIITGKKTSSNTNIPYNYKSPFASFIKATSNLTSTAGELSLVANYQKQQDGNYIKNKEDSITILNLIENLPTTEIPYTKIGLKANFKSLLPSNVIEGNYGLALTINNGQGWLDPVALDCEDMFGNPYQFFTYINQEIVFEIPKTVTKIAGLKLIFFQEGNFTEHQNSNEENNIFGELIDDNFGGVTPNLFVSSIELYFGYDAADLSGDKYKIYIEDNKELSYNYNNEQNTREVLGEWIHVDEKTGESIIFNKNINFENIIQDEKLFKGFYWPKEYDGAGKVSKYQGIKWYHKKHGASDPDGYAGMGWEILTPSSLATTNPLAAHITLNNNTLEDMFKSIIFDDLVFDEIIDLTETVEVSELIETEENDSEILINYIKSCKPISSNTLTFSNIDFDINGANSKLNLVPRDGYNGNYYFYQFSTIENKEWAKENRYLDIYYEGEQLTKENKYRVEWIVPYSNTMFNIATYKIMGTAIQDISKSEYKNIISAIRLNKNKEPAELDSTVYYKIIIDNTKDNNIEDFSFSLQYQIRDTYNAENINNNIDCKVYRLYDDIPYITSRRFNFGQNSTSGTEVYLNCEVTKYNSNTKEYEIVNPPVIQMNYESEQIFKITPQLRLNSSNEIIDNIKFEYSWDGVNTSPKGIISPTNSTEGNEINSNESIEVKTSTIIDDDDYAVLKITASYEGVQNLTRYIPFAYADKIGDEYAEVPDGPFEVIYNSDSGLPFDKSSYNTSYNIDNLSELNWDIYKQGSSLPLQTEDDNNTDIFQQSLYYPQIKNNKLIPATLFIENLDKVSIKAIYTYYDENKQEEVNQIAWSQPLLILKNRFPNSIINEWNGELIVDNDKNTIMSAMMAAGTKNKENQFSGVLMGKVQGSGEDSFEQHGIYGYNYGDQSFAFKADGTAFIGKHGKGRIEFNGNKGVIKNANIEENDIDNEDLEKKFIGNGIYLDLDGDDNQNPYFIMQDKPDDLAKGDFITYITPKGMTIYRGDYEIDDNQTIDSLKLFEADYEKILIPRLSVKDGIHFSDNNTILRSTNSFKLPTSYLKNSAILDNYIESMKWIWDEKPDEDDNIKKMRSIFNLIGNFGTNQPMVFELLQDGPFIAYPFSNCTVLVPDELLSFYFWKPNRINEIKDEMIEWFGIDGPYPDYNDTLEGFKLLSAYHKNLTDEIINSITNKTLGDYLRSYGTALIIEPQNNTQQRSVDTLDLTFDQTDQITTILESLLELLEQIRNNFNQQYIQPFVINIKSLNDYKHIYNYHYNDNAYGRDKFFNYQDNDDLLNFYILMKREENENIKLQDTSQQNQTILSLLNNNY